MLLHIWLGVLLVSQAESVSDFDETRNGYEFIYHDSHDLLLVLHDNVCYFANFAVSDTSLEAAILLTHRDQFEDLVIRTLQANNSRILQQSSLEEVRGQFQDRLADYHCFNNLVYTLDLQHLEFCPPEYNYRNGDYCYYLSSSTETWNEALQTCKSSGGYLAEIHDNDQLHFVKHIVIDHSGHFGFHYAVWLGGNDRANEGHWRWASSGSPVVVSDWAPGEPDSNGQEDCMCIVGGFFLKWNDAGCSVQKHFICQHSISF